MIPLCILLRPTILLGRIISRFIYFTVRLNSASCYFSTIRWWTAGLFLLQAVMNSVAKRIQVHVYVLSVCVSISWVCTFQKSRWVLEKFQNEFVFCSLDVRSIGRQIAMGVDTWLLILKTNGSITQILFLIAFPPKVYPDKETKVKHASPGSSPCCPHQWRMTDHPLVVL